MEYRGDRHGNGGYMKFFSDFRALFVKTFLLTIRRPGQTIAEIFLAYTFMGFLLGMRYILDRRAMAAFQYNRFRPQDTLLPSTMGTTTYYYPGLFPLISFFWIKIIIFLIDNICAMTIVNSTVNDLSARWYNFPTTSKLCSNWNRIKYLLR